MDFAEKLSQSKSSVPGTFMLAKTVQLTNGIKMVEDTRCTVRSFEVISESGYWIEWDIKYMRKEVN